MEDGVTIAQNLKEEEREEAEEEEEKEEEKKKKESLVPTIFLYKGYAM